MALRYSESRSGNKSILCYGGLQFASRLWIIVFHTWEGSLFCWSMDIFSRRRWRLKWAERKDVFVANPNFLPRVHGNVPHLFDFWANPAVHRLLPKSSMVDPRSRNIRPLLIMKFGILIWGKKILVKFCIFSSSVSHLNTRNVKPDQRRFHFHSNDAAVQQASVTGYDDFFTYYKPPVRQDWAIFQSYWQQIFLQK